MLKTYKYRIYPDYEQKAKIAKTIGCCRFVYNQALAYRKGTYLKENRYVFSTECASYCSKELYSRYPWLKDADPLALTGAIDEMDAACRKCFSKYARYPAFRSRYDGFQSYTIAFLNGNIAVDFERGNVALPELREVKASLHRIFHGRIKSATVSQLSSGKYYVSLSVETDHEVLPQTEKKIGLDFGRTALCVTSDGKEYEYPDNLKQEQKLERLQRQLVRKQKGSRNYEKKKKQIALCREKLANSRKDFLHKMSHEIILENRMIVLENLETDSVQKYSRAEAVPEVARYEILKQLVYKAKWNKRNYIGANLFFNGIQSCAVCGYQNGDIENRPVIEQICPMCGTVYVREGDSALIPEEDAERMV